MDSLTIIIKQLRKKHEHAMEKVVIVIFYIPFELGFIF